MPESPPPALRQVAVWWLNHARCGQPWPRVPRLPLSSLPLPRPRSKPPASISEQCGRPQSLRSGSSGAPATPRAVARTAGKPPQRRWAWARAHVPRNPTLRFLGGADVACCYPFASTRRNHVRRTRRHGRSGTVRRLLGSMTHGMRRPASCPGPRIARTVLPGIGRAMSLPP